MSKKKRGAFLGLSALIIVICAAAIFKTVFVIQDKMEESAVSTTQRLLERLIENLSDRIRADEEAILYLADTLDTEKGEASIRQQLQSFQDTYGMLDVFWINSQGQSYNGQGEPLTAAEYRTVEPDSLVGFSDAFNGSYGVWETDYRAPVVRDGVEIGAIYACIPLDKYKDGSTLSYYGSDGMAYMFDTNTNKIVLLPYTPNEISIYMQELDQLFVQLGYSESDFEKKIAPVLSKQDNLVIRGPLQGKDVYVTLMNLPIKDSWYICGVVPVDTVQREADTILRLILAVLVFMGVFLIILLGVMLLGMLLLWNHRHIKQKMEHLHQAEIQNLVYDTIGDASDICICVCNWTQPGCEVVFRNMNRILGLDADNLLKDRSSLALLLDSAEPGLYSRICRDGIHQVCSYQFSYEHPVRHEKREIHMSIEPLSIQNQECMMLVAEDITKEVQLQTSLSVALENANQANRAKSEFLSRMSHDIRTPINAIIGMQEIAVRHLDEPDRLADCLQKIKLSSAHLLGLVNDVLDLSKIESGKLLLHNEPFVLSDVLSTVMSIIQNQAAAKKQCLRLDADGLVNANVVGDEVRLKQILINLLNNAVKYTPQGGNISLTVREKENARKDYCTYTFRIQDDGVGMSPKFLEKIGSPFEQESNIFHKSELGSGLGLAIVKNLVTLKGGTFSIESQKNVGTIICLEFSYPREITVADTVAVKPAEICVAKVLKDKRVLLVEDNELNREIAMELLRFKGMLVEIAEDGVEAVERFQSSAFGYFDLILMDLQMPRMDGYTATQTIRATKRMDSNIPIIAMTANAFAEDILRCRQSGMNAHLRKPIEVDTMYQCIAKILEEESC